MKIKARPGSGGRARNKLLKASSPPAEAPMATIGKLARLTLLEASWTPRLSLRFAFFFFAARGMICTPGTADSIKTLDYGVNLGQSLNPGPRPSPQSETLAALRTLGLGHLGGSFVFREG